MTVGTKAILVQLGICGTFVTFVISMIVAPSQPWWVFRFFLSAIVIFGTWLWTLDCPRCGHNVTSRPIRWFHDFPIMTVGDVFHRRCRWCGYDLRSPSHEGHHRSTGRK